MSDILYHLTIPPPAAPELDAAVQEVEALRKHFGGSLTYLNPNRGSRIRLPRVLFGFHLLHWMRRQEAAIRAHHVFNPDPYAFPVLRALRRPIVYSLTGGVGDKQPGLTFLATLAAITVSDQQSLDRLGSWGLTNSMLVRPGIDTRRFRYSPAPVGSEVRLMVGSAPWSRDQFRRKGIDVLLEAARQAPQLHLTFLWRGVLSTEMAARVRRAGIENRVEVINEVTDVNQVLARVHGTISLVTDAAIIRPYPHSLLESLAAGKPVLLSRMIPMARYVEQTGCGIVVEQLDPAAVGQAVEQLMRNYSTLQAAALEVGQRDFSQEAMISSFQTVYERVLQPIH